MIRPYDLDAYSFENCLLQYFQKVIPHQFDSCPDKLILKAYQVKYNPKKMKRYVFNFYSSYIA